jgi:hypothetical protein
LGFVSFIQKPADFQEEISLGVLRRLYQTTETSQRTLARELSVSPGSANFCFHALVEKDWIKMLNFSQNKSKLRHACFSRRLG